MLRSVKHILEDLGQYPKTVIEQWQLRQGGQGVDFTAPEYRQQLTRTVAALHPERMHLRVTAVIKETSTTKTFRLVRVDEPMPPFRAGQYVNWFVTIGGVRTSRPYSMSSAPNQEHLDLTIRATTQGFVSQHLLKTVAVGDSFETTGPAGSLYHEPLIDGGELVFIAGGSGITPFMSILRDQAAKGWPLSATLLYGSRLTRDVIFDKELKALAKGNDRFTYVPVISEPPKGYRGKKGFITAKVIGQAVGSVAGKTFYLCGPNAMYDFVAPELAKLDVPRHKIKRELYGPPADVTKMPGWPKRLKATKQFAVRVNGTVIQAAAGEPLINSLERHGIVVPAVCRSGECSACRTKLVAGEVYMPPYVGLRESDRHYGYIHACVAYPISDIEIRI
ncbi:MAG: FAD-binding oxidoreductase [Candidatus Lernaella stagnicola]|nr:FAD-binding oxidoreductase [Candidatus Lernaella stagnicola]